MIKINATANFNAQNLLPLCEAAGNNIHALSAMVDKAFTEAAQKHYDEAGMTIFGRPVKRKEFDLDHELFIMNPIPNELTAGNGLDYLSAQAQLKHIEESLAAFYESLASIVNSVEASRVDYINLSTDAYQTIKLMSEGNWHSLPLVSSGTFDL